MAPETLVALAGERPGAALSPEGLAWPLADETTLDGLDALFGRLRPSL